MAKKTPPKQHNGQETRTLETAEIRAAEDTRNISGYALKFNVWSKDLGGFIERIDPAALDGVLEDSDIKCLLNHSHTRGILARADKGNGSLNLTIDNTGLKYEFTAPNFPLGDEVLEGIKRGDIKGSSFAFTTEKDKWEYDKDKGIYMRTIVKIRRMYDVSPVYTAAYTDTEPAVRSLEQHKAEETPAHHEFNRNKNYKTLL